VTFQNSTQSFMDRPRANRKPSFRAQATLIVLPVVILASVGAWSLRQDRLLAEQEARDRARQLAEMLLPELAEALAQLHTHADSLGADSVWVVRRRCVCGNGRLPSRSSARRDMHQAPDSPRRHQETMGS
jgi:hypothetical protein